MYFGKYWFEQRKARIDLSQKDVFFLRWKTEIIISIRRIYPNAEQPQTMSRLFVS